MVRTSSSREGIARGAIDDAVCRIVDELQRRHGWCWATERGLREELERQTGRRVGARSIGRALKRLSAQGIISHRRVMPGRRMANGQLTSHGTQHNRHVPRWELRAKRKRAAKERERARIIAEQLAERERAAERKRLAGRQPPEPREEPLKLSEDKQRELARLIAAGDFVQLELFFAKHGKPPDG